MRIGDGSQSASPAATGTLLDLFFGSWDAFLFGGMQNLAEGKRYGYEDTMISDYYYEESDPDKRRDHYLEIEYVNTKDERERKWRDEYIRTHGHPPEYDDVVFDDGTTDDEDPDPDPDPEPPDLSTLLFLLMMMGGGLGATQTDGGMQQLMLMMMMMGGGGLGLESLFGG
jgi:hypothetical protein